MNTILARELAWLDHLLQREVRRQRAVYELAIDEFRGLFVSDDQVDAYFRAVPENVELGCALPCPAPEQGSPLAAIAKCFNLDPMDVSLLVVALAPELDRRYETTFAYLNNDIGRKWPTIDLACRLLDDRSGVHAALLPGAALVATGLVEVWTEGAGRRPERATAFGASLPASRFVQALPAPLPEGAQLVYPSGADPLPSLAPLDLLVEANDAPALMVLIGAIPLEPSLKAEGLADALARPVIWVDLKALDQPHDGLRALHPTAHLERAAVLVEGLEGAIPSDALAGRRLAAALAALPGPTIIVVQQAALLDFLEDQNYVACRLAEPDRHTQRTIWGRCLARAGLGTDPAVLQLVTERFRLEPTRIERAVGAAAVAHRLSASRSAFVSAEELCTAAREESGSALRSLAIQLPVHQAWTDLILPAATLVRVRAVADAIANRARVQDEWGMARLSGARGLVALFQGASGTGKTMSAGVIAHELGLDLFRIDLSSTVSKYIGETEKNLERLFRAAQGSNAILLFDEADALFGKRSEVKDAHDRYANIEVSYLLQRMEEHDGPMILATNFARNIDQAFARRLQHVVEFPSPDAEIRERLWHRMLAPPLPLENDVDRHFLAHAFELTGGEIRKAALDAAFAAAAGSNAVGMMHLVTSAAQEVRRQGRLVGAADLGIYGAHLREVA